MFKKIFTSIFGERKPPELVEFNNPEELRALLLQFGMGEYTDRLVNAAKNAAHLQKTEDSAQKVGTTKIGGNPDMPDALDWPFRKGEASIERNVGIVDKLLMKRADPEFLKYHTTPQPLHFMAQVNLSEMPPEVIDETGLPKEGMLYFFYDVIVQIWGFDPQDAPFFRVLYVENLEKLSPRKMPKNNQEEVAINEVQLKPNKVFQAIPPDGIRFDALNLSEEAVDKYWEFIEAEASHQDFSKTRHGWPNNPAHQLGGWAENIQNPMEEECAVVSAGQYAGDAIGYESEAGKAILAQPNDWQLLFQLDSDDDADIMWGDAGRIYYWIKKDDLMQQNFENVWVVLQCG